jgi:hypothetical protein
MFEVTWLPEALADLEKHFDFLNEKSPKGAKWSAHELKGQKETALFLRSSPSRKSVRVPEVGQPMVRSLIAILRLN